MPGLARLAGRLALPKQVAHVPRTWVHDFRAGRRRVAGSRARRPRYPSRRRPRYPSRRRPRYPAPDLGPHHAARRVRSPDATALRGEVGVPPANGLVRERPFVAAGAPAGRRMPVPAPSRQRPTRGPATTLCGTGILLVKRPTRRSAATFRPGQSPGATLWHRHPAGGWDQYSQAGSLYHKLTLPVRLNNVPLYAGVTIVSGR